ncbi:uncharacterized protein BDZ99DRAFT_191785 [Mytilinidion resinicola]|uniref:Uncharacterized protein n=1 Tax=Mytilinidion resinicola TaxID=574789 RepID=A0A6A6Z4S3_9PEZI|nr:uncharacterized protein BDZ99DRAFT_191785 [Mytilinidion resinicola]KAF2815175.1 hypothetical protein BDZ99DRAFT_191785 [Mytilinidion resinicola]
MARKALLQVLDDDFPSKYPGGVSFFRKAFRGASKIDLSPFSRLPNTAILHLLEDLEVTSTVTSLDVSMCQITGEDLKALVSSCKTLKELVLMHMPQLDLQSAVSAIAGSNVSELLHTDLFISFFATDTKSASSLHLPVTRPGRMSPVSQILRLGLEESDTDMTAGPDAAFQNMCDKLREDLSMSVHVRRLLDIRDAWAPLNHVVCTIARILRGVYFGHYTENGADSKFVAASLAVGPTVRFEVYSSFYSQLGRFAS